MQRCESPLKIPGTLKCENRSGGTTIKMRQIPVALKNDAGAVEHNTITLQHEEMVNCRSVVVMCAMTGD